MKKDSFFAMLQQQQFKIVGNSAYGMLREFPVVYTYINNGTLITAVIRTHLDEPRHQVQELKKEAGVRANRKMGFFYNEKKNCLTINLTVGRKEGEQEFAQLTQDLYSILTYKGIHPLETCPFCGQRTCDTVAAVDTAYATVHRGCLENALTTTSQKAQRSQDEGSYLLGIIGAILGAFVGVLPSLLTIITTNTIYSLLFALIPLCIYYGYKLFRGRMNKSAIVITIVLSVLSVYLIEFDLIVYTFLTEYETNFGEALSVAFHALGYADVWVSMTLDSLTSFLFIALGIFIAWGQISRTGSSVIRNVDAIRSTAVPYDTMHIGYNNPAQETSEDSKIF